MGDLPTQYTAEDWGTPPIPTPLDDLRAIRELGVTVRTGSDTTMFMHPEVYKAIKEIEHYNAYLKTLPWWHWRRVVRALRNIRYLWEV